MLLPTRPSGSHSSSIDSRASPAGAAVAATAASRAGSRGSVDSRTAALSGTLPADATAVATTASRAGNRGSTDIWNAAPATTAAAAAQVGGASADAPVAAVGTKVGEVRVVSPTNPSPPPVKEKELKPSMGKWSGASTGKTSTGKTGGLRIKAALGEAIGAVLHPRWS